MKKERLTNERSVFVEGQKSGATETEIHIMICAKLYIIATKATATRDSGLGDNIVNGYVDTNRARVRKINMMHSELALKYVPLHS